MNKFTTENQETIEDILERIEDLLQESEIAGTEENSKIILKARRELEKLFK